MKYLKKTILIGLVILIYFGIWRPIRGHTHEYSLQIAQQIKVDSKISKLEKTSTVGSNIFLIDEDLTYSFKVSGGIFFLLGMLVLIIFSKKPITDISQFALLQLIILIINTGGLLLGVSLMTSFLSIPDLLLKYGEAAINGFYVFYKLKKLPPK